MNAFNQLIEELKAQGAKRVNIEIVFDNCNDGRISQINSDSANIAKPQIPKPEIPLEMLEETF